MATMPLVPSVRATKTQSVFPPRAIVFIKGAFPGLALSATVNLPFEFKGVGPLLAFDPEGKEAIDAVLLRPLGPRSEGFRPRAKLTREGLTIQAEDVVITEL